MDKVFETAVEFAERFQLQLHNKIARESREGVKGFYATDKLETGELLAQINKVEFFPSSEALPSNASLASRQIHALATALNDTQSPNPLVQLFNSEEFYQENSIYYANERELRIMFDASDYFKRHVSSFIKNNQTIINSLVQFDPSISARTYETSLLSYNSRAMGRLGFVPFIDCFNHNRLNGLSIEVSNNRIKLISKGVINPGDQVCTTYGNVDIQTHAIQYNYYDAQDDHVLSLGKRPIPINFGSTSKEKIISLCKQFPLIEQTKGRYFLQHPEAYISNLGPSEYTHAFFIALGSAINASPKSLFLALLNDIENTNYVFDMPKKAFKGRLNRFRSTLIKEIELVTSARLNHQL